EEKRWAQMRNRRLAVLLISVWFTMSILAGCGGGSTQNVGVVDSDQFTPGPSVTSVSPSSGPTAGGASVVVTGTGFSSATKVRVGANDASSFTVLSDSQLTAMAPAGSEGSVDVQVTTPFGVSPTGSGDRFTYVAPPTIGSLSPSAGPLTG